MIKNREKMVHVPAPKVNSIDTTGAGDIYSAGFLFGQVRSLDLEKSGQIGTLLASKVIQVMGPKLPDEIWKELQPEIGEILNP